MRKAIGVAMCAGVLAVLTGCPRYDASNPPKNAAVTTDAPKGEPLKLNDTTPQEAGACADCSQPAGPTHVCGKAEWCDGCKADKSLGAEAAQHVCNVSRFCNGCAHEAAIAGHRCGETRFDQATLSAADLEVEDDDDDEEPEEDE